MKMALISIIALYSLYSREAVVIKGVNQEFCNKFSKDF